MACTTGGSVRDAPELEVDLRILLIQIRDHGDVMADHEFECVQRRLGSRQVRWYRRNALVEDAQPHWVDETDAIVIGGSGDYSVHHPASAPWVSRLRRMLDRALHVEKPGFGICFGHQLVGLHLGAPVKTCEQRTEVGTVEVELTTEGQTCALFGRLGERFHVHTGHSDHVEHIPSGVELLARNDTVEGQAFRVSGTRFYTTQFHPDMTAAEARERYLRYQAAMAGVSRTATRERAERFALGQDLSTDLLGGFVDLVRAI